MNLKYKVDLGSTLCGRTIEIEAHSALLAYKQATEQVDSNGMERILQIRNDRDRIVYSYWDEQGFVLKMREE